MKPEVTFNRVSTGNFEVYVDAELQYLIFNGDAGLSGRGRNCYGIETLATKKIAYVGSLALCKKTVKHWISKNS